MNGATPPPMSPYQSRHRHRPEQPTLLGYPRSSLLVPAFGALGGLVFAVWKPGVVRSAFASPRSVAFTLIIVAAVAGLGYVLPRLGRGPLATGVAQAVPLGLAFVLTVLPAFLNKTVDEELPAGLSAQPQPSATATATATEPAPGGPASAPAPAPSPSSEPSPSPAAEPAAVEIGQAQLVGIDHDATGTVRLIRLADGTHLVRFENLDVEPGPDYHVHLVPGAGRTDPSGGTRLDALKGNRGDQNYPVPAGVSVQTPTTVLIWCRAFAVPIGAATIG